MSSYTWEDRPTPAQTSPPDSYRPDQSYAPIGSEHHSGKRFIDDQGRRGGGCASVPSLPRDYSDQGSVKGYSSEVKGYGSNPHSHLGSLKDFTNNNYGAGGGDNGGNDHRSARFSGSQNGSHLSTVKDFGSDHGSGRTVGDTRGSADYRYTGHCSGDHAINEAHRDSNYVIPPSLSWLNRRSFHMGEPCAVPLDWKYHPTLRQVPLDEHQNYRCVQNILGT